MAINNYSCFIGHLTADPELRVTTEGKEICNFSIGVDRGWGERKRSIFPRCVAFGAHAKFVSKLKKGTEISVCGEYDIRDFEKNGEKRQSHEFTITDVKAHRSPKQAEGESFAEQMSLPSFNSAEKPNFETIGKDDDLPF